MTAVLLLLHLLVNIKFQIVDKEDWRAIFAPPTSADAEKLAKFGGIVEVDETYIGCKAINKHGDRSGTIGGIRGKTPIIWCGQPQGQRRHPRSGSYHQGLRRGVHSRSRVRSGQLARD
jgi:hypothetical protein